MQVEGPLQARLPDYLSSQDLADHVRAFAGNVAVSWGASPEVLEGWQVVFRQTVFDCGKVSSDFSLGCTERGPERIQVLAWGSACAEATALAHEVGHVVLGDPDHRDARWRDPAFWNHMLETAKQTAPASCDLSKFVHDNEDHEEDRDDLS